jgi:hypothetical protein
MLDAVDQELLDERCGGGSARCGLVHEGSFQFAVTGPVDVAIDAVSCLTFSNRRMASKRQHLPHLGRPFCNIRAVCMEHRHR